MKIPKLETERLILREWNESSDYEPYSRLCADPEVMRYLGGTPMNRAEAWRHMAVMVGHWALRGYGHWVVEERARGVPVGRVGILMPEGWPGFEIGWTLERSSWGRGYAVEAAQAALAWARETLPFDQVVSCIHPDNHNSIRVAEKLGERYQSMSEIMGKPVKLYGMALR